MPDVPDVLDVSDVHDMLGVHDMHDVPVSVVGITVGKRELWEGRR